MQAEIKQIYISLEVGCQEPQQYQTDNTDLIVVFRNGKKFGASFFTYKNISVLQRQHHRSEEFFWGKFFWAPNMLLIEDCARETVEEVVVYLIEEGDFEKVFKEI